MKVWIRHPNSEQILGPMNGSEFTDSLANGTTSSEMVALEEAGQTFSQLRSSTDWLPVHEFVQRNADRLAAGSGSSGQVFPETRTSHAASAVASPRLGSPVVNRYRDAYRVGRTLVGLGNAIKVVGAVLAGIIVLASLAAGNGPLGGGAVVLGFVMAAIAGGQLWVLGVVIAAQGQILQATLDTAVSSSHFLTNPERADAMGLPRQIADRQVP